LPPSDYSNKKDYEDGGESDWDEPYENVDDDRDDDSLDL